MVISNKHLGVGRQMKDVAANLAPEPGSRMGVVAREGDDPVAVASCCLLTGSCVDLLAWLEPKLWIGPLRFGGS
jgi:hypothetical protein